MLPTLALTVALVAELSTAAAATCAALWPGASSGVPAPQGRAFLVATAERTLGVYQAGALVQRTLATGETVPACFSVALGQGGPTGPKRAQGDLKTPEGNYRLTHRNPKSSYYKSLGVSYPNADDVRASLALGVVTQTTADTALAVIAKGSVPSQNPRMGGEIFIRGMGAAYDWTLGCIAVENEVMDYLFEVGDPGTVVRIDP